MLHRQPGQQIPRRELATFLLFLNRARKPWSRYESSNCRNGNTPGNFRRHAEKNRAEFFVHSGE